MSIRVYHGPHAPERRRRAGILRAIPIVFAVLTITAQITWVLTDNRFLWTHIVVGLFFLATASHALVHRGLTWTSMYIAITLLFGYFIELLGTSTGYPFGDYDYARQVAGNSVPAIAGVPLIVPFAWSMMAYPALIVAARLVWRHGRAAVALVGAIALTAWDLFLDPQMVNEGLWTWNDTSFALPGIPEIPAQNYLGWLLSTALLMIMLSWLPPRRADNSLPIVMYLWMWLGGIIMNLFWLDRIGVALWGGLAMGAVIIPVLWRIATNRI